MEYNDLNKKYHELLYAILDRGFADKRTDEEAHIQTMNQVRFNKEILEQIYNARNKLCERIKDILDMPWPAHYGHHDPKGTAGANCPACIHQYEIKEALKLAVLDARAKP